MRLWFQFCTFLLRIHWNLVNSSGCYRSDFSLKQFLLKVSWTRVSRICSGSLCSRRSSTEEDEEWEAVKCESAARPRPCRRGRGSLNLWIFHLKLSVLMWFRGDLPALIAPKTQSVSKRRAAASCPPPPPPPPPTSPPAPSDTERTCRQAFGFAFAWSQRFNT